MFFNVINNSRVEYTSLFVKYFTLTLKSYLQLIKKISIRTKKKEKRKNLGTRCNLKPVPWSYTHIMDILI